MEESSSRAVSQNRLPGQDRSQEEAHRTLTEGAEASTFQAAAKKPEGLNVSVERSEPLAHLVTNYKKSLLEVLANKGSSTKYVLMFLFTVKCLFTDWIGNKATVSSVFHQSELFSTQPCRNLATPAAVPGTFPSG